MIKFIMGEIKNTKNLVDNALHAILQSPQKNKYTIPPNFFSIILPPKLLPETLKTINFKLYFKIPNIT